LIDSPEQSASATTVTAVKLPNHSARPSVKHETSNIMKFSFDTKRTIRNYQTFIKAAFCAGVVAIGAQSAFAQADTKPAEDQPPIILNKPADPAGKGIAAPGGVLVTAPDEEIIIDTKPRFRDEPDSPDAPPTVRRKIKIEKGDKRIESDVEQRLARMERMIERLAERENDGTFAFNDQQFGRLQKDLNRATREADIAVKRLELEHPEMGKNFTFEHKIAVAGSAKTQRKALEAQRKALQKQMEAIDKRLESLKDEANDERESESSKENSTNSDKR
jgi:hypothetical protein